MEQGQKTLSSLLRHFEGIQLTVELKSGRQFTGTLASADQSMDLTLENVTSSEITFRRSSADETSAALPLMHIRGSTIRYIHFPDNLDLSLTIKQGIESTSSVTTLQAWHTHVQVDDLMANWKPLLSSWLLRPAVHGLLLSQHPHRTFHNRFTLFSSWRMVDAGEAGKSSAAAQVDVVNHYFAACPKCVGMGKQFRPPSKKQKLRQKRKLSEDETAKPMAPVYKPCTKCHSSGLIESQGEPKPDVTLPEIAIIGGGLAGFALAAACRHRGIRHTVYERDQNFHQRSQGYGLTMQQASKALSGFGIKVLENGITSTKHLVHTPDGSVVGEWGLRKWGRTSKTPPKRQNVHVARQSLRWQLYRAAGDSCVEWDHQLLRYQQDEKTGKTTVEFQTSGGELVSKTVDIVVGADGIRSRVRQQLVGDDPSPLRYLGCIVILGICQLDLLDENTRAVLLLDGETVFQTADGTTRIYMMPFTESEYMWQLSFPMAEQDAISLSQRGPGALLKESVQRCKLWHTPVAEILEATPVLQVSGYPVYDRELVSKETLSNRVTLVGDACHPMSPFKGQGANQALLDSLLLARSIYSTKMGRQSIDDAFDCFHSEMLDRCAVKVKASAEAAKFLHTQVAIQPGNVTRGAAAADDTL